jgi:hypothetical protein
MVVLNKFNGQTEAFKLIGPECFRKKATTIYEDVRYHYNNTLQMFGLDFNLHLVRSLSDVSFVSLETRLLAVHHRILAPKPPTLIQGPQFAFGRLPQVSSG